MTVDDDAALAEPTLSPFTAADGENLALYTWPPAEGAARRGQVLIVHGLGEHAGRYAPLARRLNACGIAVRAYDHYGHGRSGGPRGGLTSDTRLLDDLADMVDAARQRMAPGEPLVLVGHSLGGLVAARFVSLALRPVDGLVLSSPALDTGLSRVQKALLATLPRVLPDLRVGNGLKVDALSHDAAVVAAYRADPLCHDRISARLGRFIADAGPATLAAAASWQVPTLLLWAGDDRLVRPEGSAEFAARAPAQWVQAECIAGAFHEIFNETPAYAETALDHLRRWLTERFPLRQKFQ